MIRWTACRVRPPDRGLRARRRACRDWLGLLARKQRPGRARAAPHPGAAPRPGRLDRAGAATEMDDLLAVTVLEMALLLEAGCYDDGRAAQFGHGVVRVTLTWSRSILPV